MISTSWWSYFLNCIQDYTHELYVFRGREKSEGEQRGKNCSLGYGIKILLWVLQGRSVLLEMSHGTVMHFSWRTTHKPWCHTKAEGGMWWRWIREAPGQTVTVFLKIMCRIIAHVHLLWKLHSIHLYGLEFILILLILCWKESSSADQHSPEGSHHSVHCRAGWHTSHQTPPSVFWKEGLAQLRSTQSHWAFL